MAAEQQHQVELKADWTAKGEAVTICLGNPELDNLGYLFFTDRLEQRRWEFGEMLQHFDLEPAHRRLTE